MNTTTTSTPTGVTSAAGACNRGATPLTVASTLPAAEPSLDRLETPGRCGPPSCVTVDRTDGSPTPHAFEHGGWTRRRDAVSAALERTRQSLSRRRRFDGCGSGFWILRSVKNPTVYRLALDRCHDRLCVPCQRARAARITANLAAHLANHPYRLVTLTLRHRTEPLSKSLDRLYAGFRRLRNTADWKKHVHGGIAFLEVTRNERDATWHAHFHVLCEGTYYAVGRLTQNWKRVTGDSTIVDIRLVRNPDSVARYITKYATKDTTCDPLRQPDAFDEYLVATAGRRLIVPFGTWARWNLLANPTDEGWTRYCHSNELNRNPHHDPDVDKVLEACVRLALRDPTATQFDLTEVLPRPPQRASPPELHADLLLF